MVEEGGFCCERVVIDGVVIKRSVFGAIMMADVNLCLEQLALIDQDLEAKQFFKKRKLKKEITSLPSLITDTTTR